MALIFYLAGAATVVFLIVVMLAYLLYCTHLDDHVVVRDGRWTWRS